MKRNKKYYLMIWIKIVIQMRNNNLKSKKDLVRSSLILKKGTLKPNPTKWISIMKMKVEKAQKFRKERQ
jgi:hypothetical protein